MSKATAWQEHIRALVERLRVVAKERDGYREALERIAIMGVDTGMEKADIAQVALNATPKWLDGECAGSAVRPNPATEPSSTTDLVQEPAMAKPHHTFLQTIGNLHEKDRITEWWTVTNEDKFYEMRDKIPFVNLFCNLKPGGLVVYLDKPLVIQEKAVGEQLEQLVEDNRQLAEQNMALNAELQDFEADQECEDRCAFLEAKVERLTALMTEAVRDFHGKSVLFSASFLSAIEPE